MPKVIRRRRHTDCWLRPKGRVDSRGLWWHYRGKWGLFEIIATPRKGATLATLLGPEGTYVFPVATLARRRSERVKKKTKTTQQIDASHLAAVESNIFAGHMGIVNHCAVTRYDDGDARKVGWVTIKTLGSAWQLEAKDPDTCCTLRVVQASLDDALALLNLLLESEEAPWEPDQWLQQAAAKSRKKA